jgi:chemotaxis protein methyltransferase WspC
MNLSPVVDLLRERIGLDAESLGVTTLPRAVTVRMQELGLTVPVTYAARLATDPGEIQHLLSHLAVPESWFFRGGEVFAYLAKHVAATVGLRGVGSIFRILSVPCSTGEEPYSLAIALAEAGVPPSAWQIEAVDLSDEHIRRARRAVFSNFSFRQTPADLKDRYFTQVEGGWELAPAIRNSVRFRQGNLLDTLFLQDEKPFDMMFCRNLFIYFHTDARRRALATLDRLLAPDGWLCTGHAEPLESQDSRFVRTGPPELFLYCRRTNESDLPPEKALRWTPIVEPEVHQCSRHAPRDDRPHAEREDHTAKSPPVAAVPQVGTVEMARMLADGGRLDEAVASCQELLARHGPSADLYNLMGVIHQARSETGDAVRSFQRALYLEPANAESLAHLVLLHQERGDDAQAQRLRHRLERIAPGGRP